MKAIKQRRTANTNLFHPSTLSIAVPTVYFDFPISTTGFTFDLSFTETRCTDFITSSIATKTSNITFAAAAITSFTVIIIAVSPASSTLFTAFAEAHPASSATLSITIIALHLPLSITITALNN